MAKHVGMLCAWLGVQGVLQPGEATEVVLQLLIVGGSDGTAELLATSQVQALCPAYSL